MKIWADDECIEVDPDNVGELEAAMLFKAKHIKAKADPDLFSAIAFMLEKLWDTATKRVDVVRCRECKHWNKDALACDTLPWVDSSEHANWYAEDFCSYGERKDCVRAV